jgi:two-component system OmpR family sensor kinase
MSIKARLALAFVGLLVIAAAVLGVVMVQTTRDSLVEQMDNRLRELQARRMPEGGPGSRGDGIDPVVDGEDEEEESFVAAAELDFTADGSPLRTVRAGFEDESLSLPDLPSIPGDRIDALVDRIVTLPSRDGELDYRVLVFRPPDGNYRVVAAPLVDVDETVSDLVQTFVITAVVVLVLGAGAVWFVVRRGLRPADRMIDTASAIAAGDLSQRVEARDDGTELGRLGAALDDMLAQLEAAFTEREESKARLEQFVADASHELRTPVTAIRGYAELYRNGGLRSAEELERAMSRIEGESARMGRLVDDLLTLARLDEHQPLEVTEVDLVQLAADAVADAQAVDPERSVVLDADDPVRVDADERRLRQVLANLLTNARVHTPPGTSIRVGVATDGSSARIMVTDDGPGIDADDRRRIFERFYRADPSRSRARGGSGLGLSIVAAVVAAHDGRVSVDSTPGAGATFTVELPAPQRAST